MDSQDPRFNPKSDFYTQTFEVLLSKRLKISHDSYLFTFSFLDPLARLGLLVTQHLIINGSNLKGDPCRRKYTATSDFNQQGSFDIPIKIYRPNVHPNFPEGGELTPWLEQLPLNSKVTIRRALGKLIYLGNGNYLKPKLNFQKCSYDRVLMVCGGTGITPAYQIISSQSQRFAKTQMIKQKLTCFMQIKRNRISCFVKNQMNLLRRIIINLSYTMHQVGYYIILWGKIPFYSDKKPDANWKGFEGFVSLDMFKQIFPKVDGKTLGLLCGPKQMNKLVISLYKQLGLAETQILKF